LADNPSAVIAEVADLAPGAVELPNDEVLSRDLCGLERRRGTAGRDKVDHRPGSHDDMAVVCAGVVATIAAATGVNGYDIKVLIS
jgi:hypothetical protein